MKNALILTGVWLGILVTAYAIVFWDQGIDRPLPISLLEQQADVTASEIVHPDGLYGLTVPMGWQVLDEDPELVAMEDPNGSITVWVVAVDTASEDNAVADAFEIVGLDSEYVTSTEALAEPWIVEGVVGIYASQSDASLVVARAQSPEEWTVVMLAHGPERALEALSENLEWIWLQLAVPAHELLVL